MASDILRLKIYRKLIFYGIVNFSLTAFWNNNASVTYTNYIKNDSVSLHKNRFHNVAILLLGINIK